ncbi:uroporphyrinogen decarboxylase [Tistrella bauzanensis]|uniref:Uroporphyrinogen decarboxylase n=1 Tax=Tistrella bauzanensis TaxID=657419 RepID=A0ABQ1IMG9_9PROT|nr:uroporphyrinogen decarboxylase [Tistrella bauzanensis]GGB46581.1 uroporphyrinogen decarboxylase [Tistrella bauzanensis]
MTETTKPLLAALKGGHPDRTPIWLMRQAGRYLPEYRALRAQANGFLDLCYTPDFATEVTLQPLRRFDLDAAILFSDILVVPHGLGQTVWFVEGEGPKLEPLTGTAALDALDLAAMAEKLKPVYETAARVKAALPAGKALIGFAGAPWTVATYMLEGGSSRDFLKAKRWAYGDPDGFQRLIDLLVDATVQHLEAQIAAGAEAVQIFDSWAGALDEEAFERWTVAPIRAIASRIRANHPDVPITGFPNRAGTLYESFALHAGVDAVSVDPTWTVEAIARRLRPHVAVQGNLDPGRLVAGGPDMIRRVRAICDRLAPMGGFVFNLGHGVLPSTNPDHVAQVVEAVRAADADRV